MVEAQDLDLNHRRRGRQKGSTMSSEQQKPTIGRIVHYQSYGTPGGEYLPAPRAAVVTEVGEDGVVGLCVLNPTGQFFTQGVRFAATPTPGHWNWPPRA